MVTINGVEKCLAEWAREFNLHKTTVHSRIAKGFSPEEALTMPRHKRRKIFSLKGLDTFFTSVSKESSSQ